MPPGTNRCNCVHACILITLVDATFPPTVEPDRNVKVTIDACFPHYILLLRLSHTTEVLIIWVLFCFFPKAAGTKPSFAELMDQVCRSKETALLISPSFFCLLEHNHSLPSNILSIRQNSSSPYNAADSSYCSDHWSVNRIGVQQPPSLFPCSIACTQRDRSWCAIQYVTPGMECQKVFRRCLYLTDTCGCTCCICTNMMALILLKLYVIL